STVKGFAINRFGGNGIKLGGGYPHVESNRIGTNPAGTADQGNGGAGVWGLGAVGGPAAGQGNLISGNDGWGCQCTGLVHGNRLGTAVTGNARLPHRRGGIVGDNMSIGGA